MKQINPRPWGFLDEYRGKVFNGEWPTIPEMWNITAGRYPDSHCFTIFAPYRMRLSYAEASREIHRISAYLLNQGLKKGDRAALTGKNSPEWTLAYLGILFAGGVVVPIDYSIKTEETHGLIAVSGARFLFIDEEKRQDIDPENHLKLEAIVGLASNMDNYILSLPEAQDPPHEMPGENDLAAILFTSGTTGNSKGVCLSHRNFVSDCYLAQGNMDIFHSDVFYALLPLHHSYAMLAIFLETISVGAELVFSQKVVVAQMLKDFKEGRVSMFLSIPMLFNKIIKSLMKGIRAKGILVYGVIRFLMGISGFIKKVFKVNIGKKLFKGILSKVSLEYNRICICGGGPLPSSTFKLFNQLGIDFVQGYGLTETSPILALNPPWRYKENSVGKILPRVEVKIDDPDSSGNGEIVARGPMVMQGYYKNEKQTAEVLSSDGWLKTGDAGHLDSENYLFITGRKKNLIVTAGGKNVFPEEIEDEFQLFDEISQILVKGYLVDAKSKEEHIGALIYPEPEWAKDKEPEEIRGALEKIIQTVNQNMLPYKRIEKFKVLQEPLEVGGTLKIKRFMVGDF
ncbi:MAG: AMP-binding protein [Spirochaetales bacterium]|jgi:long-chain acyl-CoA synthetase|nr:AMP-binding protein [Spirochaetales bacterium]